MADGVEGSCVVCSFNTTPYARSPNCTKEIQYAHQQNKRIVLININGEMDYSSFEHLSKIAEKHPDKVTLMQPNDDDSSGFDGGLPRLAEVVEKLVNESMEQKAASRSKVCPPDIYQGGRAYGQ
jgi:hypothetical protein